MTCICGHGVESHHTKPFHCFNKDEDSDFWCSCKYYVPQELSDYWRIAVKRDTYHGCLRFYKEQVDAGRMTAAQFEEIRRLNEDTDPELR